MTVEVAGTWELGWSTPLTEQEYWHMVMLSYGITRMHMCPVSGIGTSLDTYKWITERESLDQIVADTKLTPIFLTEVGTEKLLDYKIPENALYVFGKVDYDPWLAFGKAQGHMGVQIEAAASPAMLWPHQALAVVMNDRCRRLMP